MEEKEQPILQPDVEAAHSVPMPVVESNPAPATSHVQEEKPEEARKDVMYTKNGKKVRARKVYRRNIFLSIIFSLFTSEIYSYFWIFEIDKETKAISKKDRGAAPSLVIFLTIITFGIYGFFWVYNIGRKQSDFYLSKGINKPKLKFIYLFVMLFGWVFAVGMSCFMLITTGGSTAPAVLFTTLLFTVFGLAALYVTKYVVYSLMQYNVNQMLELCDEDVYCRDSSIFNRPFWSTVFLLIVGTSFLGVIAGPVGDMLKGGSIPVPTNTDEAMKQIIRESSQEVANAGDASVIIPSIIMILTSLIVLWWFAYRFKHSNYKGVLTVKNFGKALLLCLPAFIVILTNCFGYFMGEPLPEFQRGAMWVFGCVVLGFVPGFTEEIAFRGMVVPNLVRVFNKKSGIWIALFASALIFGAIHMANVFVGADVGSSIFQVFYAFALGVIFAAVLLRTGNLWASIICHGLIDTSAFLAPSSLQEGAIQTQAFVWDFGSILMIVVSLVLLIYGIWLVRPKKQDDIMKLWREKFGDAMLQPID